NIVGLASQVAACFLAVRSLERLPERVGLQCVGILLSAEGRRRGGSAQESSAGGGHNHRIRSRTRSPGERSEPHTTPTPTAPPFSSRAPGNRPRLWQQNENVPFWQSRNVPLISDGSLPFPARRIVWLAAEPVKAGLRRAQNQHAALTEPPQAGTHFP